MPTSDSNIYSHTYTCVYMHNTCPHTDTHKEPVSSGMQNVTWKQSPKTLVYCVTEFSSFMVQQQRKREDHDWQCAYSESGCTEEQRLQKLRNAVYYLLFLPLSQTPDRINKTKQGWLGIVAQSLRKYNPSQQRMNGSRNQATAQVALVQSARKQKTGRRAGGSKP